MTHRPNISQKPTVIPERAKGEVQHFLTILRSDSLCIKLPQNTLLHGTHESTSTVLGAGQLPGRIQVKSALKLRRVSAASSSAGRVASVREDDPGKPRHEWDLAGAGTPGVGRGTQSTHQGYESPWETANSAVGEKNQGSCFKTNTTRYRGRIHAGHAQWFWLLSVEG